MNVTTRVPLSQSKLNLSRNNMSDPTAEPLSVVETVRVNLSGNELEISDASSNSETIKTALARSFSFGTVPPGGESSPVITFLRVPCVRAIGNVQIALINTGSIPFQNGIFGITTLATLQSNVIPQQYFQGVNTDDSINNSYNISLNVKNVTESDYVYLFINMPSDSNFGNSIIRYKWFFDFSGYAVSQIEEVTTTTTTEAAVTTTTTSSTTTEAPITTTTTTAGYEPAPWDCQGCGNDLHNEYEVTFSGLSGDFATMWGNGTPWTVTAGGIACLWGSRFNDPDWTPGDPQVIITLDGSSNVKIWLDATGYSFRWEEVSAELCGFDKTYSTIIDCNDENGGVDCAASSSATATVAGI